MLQPQEYLSRQALADQYYENGVLTEQTRPSGGKPGRQIFLLLGFLATCGPGDEVIIPALIG